MNKPQIAAVIAKHGLFAGQPMKTVAGDDIPGSIVLGPATFIHPRDDVPGGWEVRQERPLHGDEIVLYLSDQALRALKAIDA